MPHCKGADNDRFIPDHQVRLLSGGATYFDLLIQLLENAHTQVHLQVYAFESDETGQLVVDALVNAANRGVAVYVVVDGYGSQTLSNAIVDQFREGGVHFRFFEPLLRNKNFYLGRRMHHKVLVVDAQYAIVTGANIGNKYNDLPGRKAWLDFAVCVEGAVVQDLYQVCWAIWRNVKRKRVENFPCDLNSRHLDLDLGLEREVEIRIRRNDWVRRKYEISSTYRDILTQAQSRVILLSSYFLPGHILLRAIASAAKRGVRIQVMVCSHMDVPLVKSAERFMYNWLLRHGVEIFEYTGNMLHGKLAICDQRWMTVGSFNLNDLSARLSIELNLDVASETILNQAVHELEHLQQHHCVRISADTFQAGDNFLKQIGRWFAFRILRFLFFCGTFYVKQDKRY